TATRFGSDLALGKGAPAGEKPLFLGLPARSTRREGSTRCRSLRTLWKKPAARIASSSSIAASLARTCGAAGRSICCLEKRERDASGFLLQGVLWWRLR